MKIVVLDGYTLNPGDLSWKALEALGEVVVYDRTAPEQLTGRAEGAEALLTNKVVLNEKAIQSLPALKYIFLTEQGVQSKRIHHHVIINGGLTRDEVEMLWARPKRKGEEKGRTLGDCNADRLRTDERGLERLASYLAKDPKGRRRWTPSQNLKKPEVSVSDTKTSRRKFIQLVLLPEDAEEVRQHFEKQHPRLVGILQALASTGQVSLGAAIPIIMGQNIGTCVTAMISSVGTNKNARRAALVHLSFNVIGTAVWLAVFCVVKAIFSPAILSEPASLVSIAIVHSAFNILCTILLLPMTDVLESLVHRLVPDGAVPDTITEIDERLLATPPMALERCRDVAYEMAETSVTALKSSLSCLLFYTPELASEVREILYL